MTHLARLTPGALLLLTGLGLMGYTIYMLHGLPVLCAVVLLWLGFVEYVVVASWWNELMDVFTGRQCKHARRH